MFKNGRKIKETFHDIALLDDVHSRKSCEEIVEEAEGRTLKNMEEKRKKLIRDNKGKGLPSDGPHNKVCIT